MKVSDLLDLAEQVLDSTGEPGRFVAVLEEYSDAFAQWMSDSELESRGVIEAEKQPLLELAEKHGQIIESAQRIKDLTGEEVKNLKQKSRGLMAYVDGLPKRMTGFFSNKKG